MRKTAIGIGLVVLMAVGAGPASADKCNGSKIKAIGKKEKALLGCSAKEATKDGVEPDCDNKATGKFSTAYNKPTGCVPSAPAEGTCETVADSCQTMIRAVLPDGNGATTPSKCESSRLKAAGKLGSAELSCYSKAATKGVPLDTASCIPKATAKFTASFNKVTGCTGDGMASAVQTDVENDCVKNMVAVDGGGNFLAITCGGAPPTTTTTTTTLGSTTTTTIAGPCCGVAPTRLSFTTGVGSGNCGTVQLSNGSTSKNLACSGLYTGGGQNSVPLPYAVPDQGVTLTGVSACNGGTGALTLTNLSSGTTGSNRNCSTVGCLFGPPLPIPNPGSTPTSVCVINVVATNASGTANCNTGATHLSLPLTSQLYLAGDLYPTAPGIQVCPVCNGTCTGGTNATGPCNTNTDCPGGGTCGGPNVCHSGAGRPGDGNPCTPADSATLGTTNSFPTSQDCPPDPALGIGGLPIAFDLTTGTTSKTAAAISGQAQVFCGYCRDVTAAGTGCFEGDPDPACPRNSACLSAGNPFNCCTGLGTGSCNVANPKACSSAGTCTDGGGSWPDCNQRNPGAFGPAGGGAHTINETGSPAGNMTDGAGHASTLASIFCIQPTFNATVDAAGDLPGPGAVTLFGTAQLLP